MIIYSAFLTKQSIKLLTEGINTLEISFNGRLDEEKKMFESQRQGLQVIIIYSAKSYLGSY